jgi:hypothetical protein
MRHWEPGDPLTAENLNQSGAKLIRWLINSLRGGRGISIQRSATGAVISYTGAGATVSSGGGGASVGLQLQMVTLVSAQVLDDGAEYTLLSVTTTGDDIIYAARPPHLREGVTGFRTRVDDGVEEGVIGSTTPYYERSVEINSDDGLFVERQRITPSYYEDESLLIGRVDTGLTKGGEPVNWIDLNVSARTWAAVPS